jgi:hypothetical protein
LAATLGGDLAILLAHFDSHGATTEILRGE